MCLALLHPFRIRVDLSLGVTGRYNRLDVSYGDGDGILSANDQCWGLMQQNGFVQGAAQTSLTFDQFREGVLRKATEETPFCLDRASFTMDAAVVYVYQKLNEAVLSRLNDIALKLSACPSIATVPQGACPELDRPPRLAPQPLVTHALSLALDDTMLADLTLLYKDLDEDDSGSLEAEDFLSGAAMQELWRHIAALDEDGDGQISMDEFIRGIGRNALQKTVEFDLGLFQHSPDSPCTLKTFLTGERDRHGVVIRDERFACRVDLTSLINERTRELYSTIRSMVPLRHGISSDAVPL